MDIPVKAFVGDLEVIGNGIVHVNLNQPLNLLIDNNLEMEFEFQTDNQDKELRTSSRIENNKWIWELVNYSNSLGTGVIVPIEIGNLRGKKLYASFFVWTPSSGDGRRVINYVIYTEKED